jgi:hypothetical protein
MNHTRILMTLSAIMLAVLGLPCIFAPEIVLARMAGSPSFGAELIVQITGALYLGFAGLNWMGRANLIGGIYGRPVAIGNLMHFLVGAFALFKAASTLAASVIAWGIAIDYAIFATWFAFVAFGNPLRRTEGKSA